MPATLCCLLKEDNPPHPVPISPSEVTPLLSRSLAVGSVVCNELSSRCPTSECISSAQYLSCENSQEVSSPKNSSGAQSTPSIKNERETPQGMSTIEILGTQRSSLQTTSKNNLKGVPPKDESDSKQDGNGYHYRRNSGMLLQFARDVVIKLMMQRNKALVSVMKKVISEFGKAQKFYTASGGHPVQGSEMAHVQHPASEPAPIVIKI
ncbi:hypothetical protein ACRRTK_020430 [Alexandromys fortis]